jgi:hypothetical protein
MKAKEVDEGFTIRTDQLNFSTGDICDVERMANMDLLVTLETDEGCFAESSSEGSKVKHKLTGHAAIQAWAQLMELVEWPDEEKAV